MQTGIVPVLNRQSGGIYQYSSTILTLLYHQEPSGEYVLFVEDSAQLGYLGDKRAGWTVRPMEPFHAGRVLKKYARRILGDDRLHELWDVAPKKRQFDKFGEELEEETFDPDVINYRPEQGRWFAKCGAEMMLYPAPTVHSFESGIPYVMAVHDVQHRLQPEFPEVSADGRLEAREYLFRNGTRYALTVLAVSEAGKEDILNCYGEFGITADRVQVLPYVPPPYLDPNVSAEEVSEVRARYGLPERYLFCPAHFWPHKNHAKLVDALFVMQEEYGLRIPLILCGSSSGKIRTGRFEEVMGLVLHYGLDDRVRYLGFVADEDMAALYAGARAVVFPTCFASAGIPIVEAWALGSPVIASDIRGVREQVGDAGFLVDPRSAEALADGIRRVWVDTALRSQLIERGYARIAAYTAQDFRTRLNSILKESASRIDTMEDP